MRNVNIKRAAKIIWEFYALLYCCGRYFVADRKLNLYDNTTHKNRVFEVGTCPHCQAIKALITQCRIEDGKKSEKKPKNSKDVARFIRKYEKEAYYEIPDLTPKYGTKANMSWRYADASKSSWVKDFNNVRQFKLNKEVRIVS